MMGPKICPSCRKYEYESGDKFCEFCGNNLPPDGVNEKIWNPKRARARSTAGTVAAIYAATTIMLLVGIVYAGCRLVGIGGTRGWISGTGEPGMDTAGGVNPVNDVNGTGVAIPDASAVNDMGGTPVPDVAVDTPAPDQAADTPVPPASDQAVDTPAPDVAADMPAAPAATLLSGPPDTAMVTFTRIPVIAANASSIVSQNVSPHEPMLLFDDNEETNWQEGVDGFGEGENVSFSFDRVYQVKYLAFKLGNWKSDDDYYANGRPKTLTIVLGDYSWDVTFNDERTTAWVELSQAVDADSMRVEIREVYPGTVWEDTCITDIMMFGD